MDFGIAIPSGIESWRTVRRAEELGFTHAWFYDSQMLYADVFVVMTMAAINTDRIRLGTGVLIPSNRIAPVAANALASLENLAPGRIDFGIGTGFTGRRTIGLGAMKLSAMEDYIRIVRELWEGETVEWVFEEKRRKIRFLNARESGFRCRHPIPLHISAFAPKARALTARMADGWMNFLLGDDAAIADAGTMAGACRAADREPSTLYSTLFALGCILEEGESPDAPRARAQAGPLTAVMLHNFAEMEERGSISVLPEALRALVDAYRDEVVRTYEPPDARYLALHTGHLLYVKPEEEPFLPGELVAASTLTGTRAELLERIRRFGDGYDQLAIQVIPGHEDALEDWADLFSQV